MMAHEKFHFTNPKSSLLKYSEKDIEDIINCYEVQNYSKWEVLKKYPKLNKCSSFVKEIPYVLSDEKCNLCNAHIYTKIRKLGNVRELLKVCINCHHDYTDACTCAVCIKERKAKLNEEKAALDIFWDEEIACFFQEKIEFEQISVLDEIKIGFIIQKFYNELSGHLKFSEDKNILGQINDDKSVLEIIEYFINRKILIPVKTYDLLDIMSTVNVPYYLATQPTLFQWELNISFENKEFTIRHFSEHIKNKIYSDCEKFCFWKEIYKGEITTYIDFYSNQFLKFKLDESICNNVTEILINDYNLSKAFALIYSALGSTLNYQNFYHANKKQMISYFKNKISELVEKFKQEKIFKDFTRPSMMPFTDLNDYILKEILQVKTGYFYFSTNNIIPNYKFN